MVIAKQTNGKNYFTIWYWFRLSPSYPHTKKPGWAGRGNMESTPKSESELIDQILREAEQGWVGLMRDTPDDYQAAVEKAKRLGLLKAVSKSSFEITNEGYDALEMGGFDKWNEERRRRKSPQPPSINVGGHAVIGDNNSGVNQSRDFLNNASPITQNATPSEKPADNPIKKSDHTSWDKLKYIAGISAAIAAIIGLVKACMS